MASPPMALRGAAALLFLVATAVVACGEDEEATLVTETPGTATVGATARATRAPTPEATDVPESGGFDGFRIFAAQIDAALQSDDADFFVDRADVSSLTCPNEFEPRCNGQPDGTTVEGIPLSLWASDGGSLLPPDDFRADLSEYLTATSEVSLFALAEKVSSSEGRAAPSFAIVSGTGDPSDTTRIFEYVFRDGAWRLRGGIMAGVLAEADWLSGTCSDCYDQWERWEGS